MGTTAINKRIEIVKDLLERNNYKYFSLHEATPEEFYEAIGKAKESNKFGAFVECHTIEEYRKMRFLFLTDDNMAGIAITYDNNIVSIFNGGEQRGVLKTLLPVAIDLGGNKLDNYDSDKLSSLYELYGFNPVSKTRFDVGLAPEDWDFERDGKPDIVFWIHNGDDVEDVLFNFGGYDVDWDNVVDCPSYEEAEKYRDSLIQK